MLFAPALRTRAYVPARSFDRSFERSGDQAVSTAFPSHLPASLTAVPRLSRLGTMSFHKVALLALPLLSIACLDNVVALSPQAEGVKVVREFETMAPGTYLGRSCDYEYKDCVVPARNMLGAEGMGFRYMMDQLNRNRTVIGARLGGTARWAQGEAIKRARERETFGKPLSERQAIQWMLVDVLVDLQAIRAISYQCAAAADRGEDVRVAAAMAKLVGGNWGHRSIDKIMQVFGGTGESLDMPISHWYRELRHGRIGGGTDEMQRMLIARGLFAGKPELWRA